MKILLEMNNEKYLLEKEYDDIDSKSLLESFKRLMVVAGFSASVMNDEDDDGRWVWVRDDEEVVKKDESR